MKIYAKQPAIMACCWQPGDSFWKDGFFFFFFFFGSLVDLSNNCRPEALNNSRMSCAALDYIIIEIVFLAAAVGEVI
jgi:hypothetical protein